MKTFDGYKKQALTDVYALLAGGGHKPLSEFSMAHTHPYLPLTGGTMLGALNFKNGTWNLMGDDAYIGDCNVAGMIGVKGANAATPGFALYNNSGTLLGKLYASGSTLIWSGDTIQATTFNGNAATASKLGTSTIGATNIPIYLNGGTPTAVNLNSTANNLINNLSVGDSVPTDNDYYISQYVNGGTTNTTYYRRSHLLLYNYIKGKAEGTWNISINGNASTATNADTLDGYHLSTLVDRSGENLIIGTTHASTIGWNQNGWSGGISTYDENNGIYKMWSSNGWHTLYYTLDSQYASKSISFSFDIMFVSSESTEGPVGVYVGASDVYISSNDYRPSTSDSWEHKKGTFTLGSTPIFGIMIRGTDSSGKSCFYRIRNLKVELGDLPTIWTPAHADITWDNLTGKPSSFTPSGHNHDGRYLRYFRYTTSPNADSMEDGWHDAHTVITNAPTTNHGTLIQNSYNGTPFQIFIPDASYYIYKRYKSGNIGGTWTKIYAGYADSAGNASTATKLTSSAGNAALPIYFSDGKPVACTASSVFSNLSNSGNNISVTVAGQNRTLTVGYAGNSNTVDGYHQGNAVHYVWTNTYTQPTSGATWYLKIKTTDWKNTSDWIWVSCEGSNAHDEYVINTGSRSNAWWAYGVQYTTQLINGCTKIISNSCDTYIRLTSHCTSVRIYTTFTPASVTNDSASSYTTIVPGLNAPTFYGNATSASNSDTCDGLHVHGGRNNEANKIVRTDGNGFIQCGYINSSSGNEGNNSSPARVWGTNGSDSYMRTYLTSALSVNYASSAGNADTIDGYHANSFAASSHNHPYLPLSGGTISGRLLVNYDSNSYGTPAIAINYYDSYAVDEYSIAQIKMGTPKYDAYLGLSPSAKGYYGKVGYFMHIASDCEFLWGTSSWTKRMALECSSGNLWIAGSVTASSFVGNASSATKLTSSAGSATLPIYFSDGKPIACTASSVFSNLSNSGNNISVTVAGLNRTLTVGYASAASKINSRGNLTAYEEGSTTKGESGVNFYTVYNNGYPVTYGNLLHINGSGAGQILAEWCGNATLGHLYYRSKRDNSEHGWSAWGKVAFITDNVTSATKLQTARTIWGQSFNGTANIDNTLRIRQTTGNYCEGIRIQTADGAWSTIILGATADSGTNTNAWSIHRKADNNFAISRNSSDGINGLVMTSVGMGLGTTAPTHRLDVRGDTKITGSIRDLAIGGGIYWNPYVESASDGSDVASITVVKSGVAGGTTLVLKLMNDANDTILFLTSTAAKLYHNSYPILTTLNTYISNNKGYINGVEITLVNNASSASIATKLASSGYANNALSYYQTDQAFDGSATGWAHYIIANHGDGSSYYHYTIRLPFGNVPQYRRQTGSTSDVTSWYNFITAENIGSQSVNYANSAGNADTLDGLHASAFATASHSHPYLPLSGGTMTGLIKGNNKGGSWISGRSNAALYLSRTTENDWHPVVGFKTRTGSWEFGSVGDDFATFSWGSDSNYNSGTNTNTRVNLRTISGTIALTSDIPTKSSWNYDDRYSKLGHTHDDRYYTESEINSKLGAYLPLSGGTMRGNITYTGKGTSYIGNGENDAVNGVGGALNNLVISSWYGVSFTTSCSGQTYTNKNAVSINCRNGYVYANTFVGAFSGNASSATSASKWTTARTLTLTGSVTGSVSIDGSSNVTLTTTTNHTHNWANIEGKPTTFTPSFHTHDDRYYTESEVNTKLGAYLPLAGGTMNANARISFNDKGNLYIGTEDNSGYVYFQDMASQDGADYWLISQEGSAYFRGTVTATTFSGALSGNATTATTASKLGSSTVGSDTRHFYLNAGTATASMATVGGTAKPMYLKAGVMTALSVTVGSTDTPVYLNGGTITSCGKSFSSYLPLSGGTMTGSIITPANDDMGIIPYNNNYGQIGSSTKKFYRMYATTFYGSLSGNAATATNADKLDGYHASSFALSGHTHTLSLTNDTGSSSIDLVHGGKYKLTAGGNSIIFTLPTSSSINPTNFYWANVKVSAYSSTSTIPTFNKVMINTTSSSYQLNVGGDSYTSGTFYASNLNASNWVYANNIEISDDAFIYGNVNASGSTYAAHFYENSDIRYKKILKNLSINSNIVANLPLFDFEWIENNAIGTGTSALAVQQILPNLVSGTDKLTLDYGVLGTIAGITACKELVTLKSELLQLKEKVKLLEDKLRKYENI